MRTSAIRFCLVAAVVSAMTAGGASAPKALVVMLDGMRQAYETWLAGKEFLTDNME